MEERNEDQHHSDYPEGSNENDGNQRETSDNSNNSRLIITVCIIALLALAIVINWKYYFSRDDNKEQKPVENQLSSTKSTQEQGPASNEPKQKSPKLTPSQLYQRTRKMLEIEAAQRSFTVGTKDNQQIFIIASPPIPIQKEDGTIKIIPPYAYNVTKRKEGLQLNHLYKGMFFRDQLNLQSIKTVQALGSPDGNSPKFLKVDDVYHVDDDHRVLGVVVGDEAKAYPIRMLNYHRVINDKISGTPIVVWWSPFAGMGTVAIRKVGDKEYTFGPSGRIYESTEVLYDHQTESLWAHFNHEAITGQATGTKLTPIPSILTTWKYWREKYPKTLTLSNVTGLDDPPDYFTNIFRTPNNYYTDERVPYPVDNFNPADTPLPAKEQVLGVHLNGEAKAYPFSQLKKSKTPIADTVGGQKITIHFHADQFTTEEEGKEVKEEIGTAYAVGAGGSLLEARTLCWFVWKSNFPNTKIYGIEVKPEEGNRGTVGKPEPKQKAAKEEKK